LDSDDAPQHFIFLDELRPGTACRVGFLDGFDWTGFREEMWYTYIPGDEHFVFFYLLIGMVFPLTIKYLYEKMILYLNRKINWTKIKI